MKFIDWESDITGFEKQIYLNWSPSQFAKTVYFSKGALIYGVVLPMDEKVILKDISDYLQLTKSKAKSMAISNLLPYGQMRHSVGPFISKKDIDLVYKILFMPMKELEKVDFSFPGRMDISLQIKYVDAYHLLKERYGNMIVKVD